MRGDLGLGSIVLRWLAGFVVVLILWGCGTALDRSLLQSTTPASSDAIARSFGWADQQVSGVGYRIYFHKWSGTGDGKLTVINVTKDQLEIELLRKQIALLSDDK